MASLPVPSVSDRWDRQTAARQTRHADRTLKIAHLHLPVHSGTGRQDNEKGPFFCPLST